MADPDEDLMQRLGAGEERALRELHDRYASKSLALAQRVLQDRGEAEDVVQDVFLRLWRRAAAFDPQRGSFSGWLLRSVRNRAIDRQRQRASQRRLEQARGEERPVAVASAPRASGLGEVLGSVLGSLPPEQRRPIELAYFEGLTQQEIAARLEVPLGTVKSRIRLGMGRLRDAYAGGTA